MDAIELLTQDHMTVKELFAQFERLGEDAGPRKKKIVERLIRELAIHSAIEEAIFYPTVRDTARVVQAEEIEDQILESLEEHHVVKWTLSELEKMEPGQERYDAKVKVLTESVLHHAEEEETELFPKVRQILAEEELDALGDELQMAKKVMPTRPHPRAPDQPPGNLVASIMSAVLDRGRDALRDVVRGATARVRGKRSGRNEAAPGGEVSSGDAVIH